MSSCKSVANKVSEIGITVPFSILILTLFFNLTNSLYYVSIYYFLIGFSSYNSNPSNN